MFSRLTWPLVGAALLALAASADAEPFALDSDEFPLGMYSVDSPGAMAQVKEMGIGYIHTYGMGRGATAEAIAKDRKYLAEAQEHGLKVMVNLSGRHWVTDGDLMGMHKLVMALKDHPAVGFWMLYDEPDGTHTVEDLMPYYWTVRHETPNIPVALVEAWSKNWWRYGPVCDLVQLDTYPIKDEPFPGAPLGNVTEFVGRGVKSFGKPVMPVLQCMNWKALGAKAAHVEDAAKLRYPEARELRYWCYSSLAQGVRGLFWWSYARSVQTGYGWINSVFKDTLLEVKQFTDLVKPAHKPVVFQYAPDSRVYLAIWRRPTGDFMVLTNGEPIARRIRRNNEGLTAREVKLHPWGQTRAGDAKVTGGVITVRAEPWETFVWEMEEAPAGK